MYPLDTMEDLLVQAMARYLASERVDLTKEADCAVALIHSKGFEGRVVGRLANKACERAMVMRVRGEAA